jgi:hypothetical protein
MDQIPGFAVVRRGKEFTSDAHGAGFGFQGVMSREVALARAALQPAR